jgi:hypothetical protein
MPDNLDFAHGRDAIVAFKSQQIERYCIAFVRAALRLLDTGIDRMAADDVEEDCQAGGGIPGTCCRVLLSAHVIKPTGERRVNRRKESHGRKVDVWTLTSRAIAHTYLKAHGADVENMQEQGRLAL